MDPANDPFPDGPGAIDTEVIDLEPTVMLGPTTAGGPDGLSAYATRHSAPVAIVEGSLASLAGETSELLRRRVSAVAVFLAAVSAILLVWVVLTNESPAHRHIWMMMAARCAVSVGVAAFLIGGLATTRARLLAAEAALFGGLTLVLCVSLYVIDLELLRRGDLPGVIVFVKNGVIQMFAMMVIYGTFIPNTAKATARVVLSMALAPMASLALLMEHPEVVPAIEQLRAIEPAGTNALVLLIGAGLATYGAHVLSGMRVALHESRKFGQYRLIRKLGAGGMGEVHLAEHQLLKRPCALKLIKPESGADPTALARFEREVRAAARLSHPNSIEIYDYGHADDGTFYYVMEYLPGLGLDDLVREAGTLPAGRVIYLLRQACGALAEAHSLGLIHRDLKPSNLFVARRGGESDVAKILDFGLVKLTGDPAAAAITQDLTVSGTPSYMAPEQATASADLDARADLYSLGAVAYFALTGRPPFSGATPFAVLMAHARDPVVPPSEIRPDVPADLERVVLTCLAKSPADRYPDARSLGRALAACASSADWDSERADDWWSAARVEISDAVGAAS